MIRKQANSAAAGPVFVFTAVLNAIILEQGMVAGQEWYALLFFTVPMLILSIINGNSKLPGRIGVSYRFRNARDRAGKYKREKEFPNARKSSRPLDTSAELPGEADKHVTTGGSTS